MCIPPETDGQKSDLSTSMRFFRILLISTKTRILMVLVNDLIVQHKKNNQYNVFVEPRRKVFQRSRKLINTVVISTELKRLI